MPREELELLTSLEILAQQNKLVEFRQNLLIHPHLLTILIAEAIAKQTWPNIPIINDHFPNWRQGIFFSSEPPSEEVLKYILFFGKDNNTLHQVTKRGIESIYARYGKTKYGASLSQALTFVNTVFGGLNRRTGEPVARHFERTLLRKLLACYKAELNESDESMRPYQPGNIAVTFASHLADILHDLLEDLGKEGYQLVLGDESLIVYQDTTKRQTFYLPNEAARLAETMIVAYTKPKIPSKLKIYDQAEGLYLDHGTLAQTVHLEREVEEEPRLAQILLFSGKIDGDRTDNVDTETGDKILEKLLETLEYFSDYAGRSCVWQHRDAFVESAFTKILPPKPLDRAVLRLLGLSPNDLFLPAIAFCRERQLELDQQGVEYVVIIDPFQPTIFTADGRFIPLTVYPDSATH